MHLKAHGNLVNRYELWRKALKISWKEYLSQIAESSSAGDWVREVAKYLIENGETHHVRKSEETSIIIAILA